MNPSTPSFDISRLPPELRLQIWEEAWLAHHKGVGRVVDVVTNPEADTGGTANAAASGSSRPRLTLPRFALANSEALDAVLRAHPRFCIDQPHTSANFSIDTLRWKDSPPETPSPAGFSKHRCRNRRRVERIILQSSAQGFVRPRTDHYSNDISGHVRCLPLDCLDTPLLRHVWFEYLLSSQDASLFALQKASSRHIRFENQTPLHCYLFRYFSSSGRVQVARLDASPAKCISQVDGPLAKQMPAGSMLAYERQVFWASAKMHNRRALYARICIIPGGHPDSREDHRQDDRRVGSPVCRVDSAVIQDKDSAKDDEGSAPPGPCEDHNGDVGEWCDVLPWSEGETEDQAHCRTVWRILVDQAEARLLDPHP